MVRLILPLCIVAVFALQSFNEPVATATDVQSEVIDLGEFLYTVPLSKHVTIEDAQLRWYHEYFEPQVNDSVFGPMLQQIKDRKIEVFQPQYPFTEKVDREAAREMFVRRDSVQVEDPENPDMFKIVVVITERQTEEIESVTFHESWTYDAATLTLTKTVKGIIPNFSNEEFTATPTCYIPMNTNRAAPALTVHGITSDFIPDGTCHRSSDIIERTCRDSVISERQARTAKQLLTDLSVHAQQKSTELYEPVFPFSQPVGKKQKPENAVLIGKANALMFYEDWLVNSDEHVFRKVVHGVIPMIEEKVTVDSTHQTYWSYSNIALIPFNGFVPGKPVASVCEIDRISYYTLFRNPGVYERTWMSFEDTLQLDSMAFDIKEHAVRMELPVFGPTPDNKYCDPFGNPCVALTAKEVKNLFTVTDTVIEELFEEPYVRNVVREYEIDRSLTSGFKFFESWKIDFTKQTFIKQTKYVGVTRLLYSAYGDIRSFAYTSYYYKNPGAALSEMKAKKYSFVADVISGCLLNSNEFNYDEDWNGNRHVSYFNEWQNNIPASRRYAFIQPIIDLVRQGKIKAYREFSSQSAMSVANFDTRLNEISGVNSIKAVQGFEYALLNQIYFHEKWYYDLATGQISKEVVGITFAFRGQDSYDPVTYEVKTNIMTAFTIRLNQAG